MKPTVVIIGAGSVEFTRELLGDILSFPELGSARVVLHDIDDERLETAEAIARVGTFGSPEEQQQQWENACSNRPRQPVAGHDRVVDKITATPPTSRASRSGASRSRRYKSDSCVRNQLRFGGRCDHHLAPKIISCA